MESHGDQQGGFLEVFFVQGYTFLIQNLACPSCIRSPASSNTASTHDESFIFDLIKIYFWSTGRHAAIRVYMMQNTLIMLVQDIMEWKANPFINRNLSRWSPSSGSGILHRGILTFFNQEKYFFYRSVHSGSTLSSCVLLRWNTKIYIYCQAARLSFGKRFISGRFLESGTKETRSISLWFQLKANYSNIPCKLIISS